MNGLQQVHISLQNGAPRAYNQAEELDVRRSVYLVLAVLLVQLSGLGTLCLPMHSQPHACCPMGHGKTPVSSPSLPDCCLNSLLNYQASITERRARLGATQYTAQVATVRVVAVPAAAIPAAPRRVLPSISPPLSPLSQSCTLLI